jgi:hypothetical protein
MGGRDSAGNALNDVWSADVNVEHQLQWRQEEDAGWTPRCLIQPVEFQGRLWLFAGAEGPLAEPLYSDLWVLDDNGWQDSNMTAIFTGGDPGPMPIAACLTVHERQLYLFAKLRTIACDGSERLDPVAYRLVDPDAKRWEEMPNDHLKAWGGYVTFSYQVLSFKDQVLVARALQVKLADGEQAPPLKLYVPG